MIGNGSTVPIDATTNAVETIEQSSKNPVIAYWAIEELAIDLHPLTSSPPGSNTITMEPGHGFVNGLADQVVVIWENSLYSKFEVISVVGDVIETSAPIVRGVTTAASIIRGNRNLSVDGSGTERIFKFRPVGEIPFDVSGIRIRMISGNKEPDDSKFGGISALTKGIYFDTVNFTPVNFEQGVYKTNGAFYDQGFDEPAYDPKAGGTGSWGTKIKLDIKKTFGNQEIRVDPRIGAEILAHVRDNNAPAQGNISTYLSILGSYTSGE